MNRRALAPVALALALAGGSVSRAATAGPFDAFAGSWSGGGTLLTDSGATERLRCRVGYDVSEAGTALALHLNCASDAARVGVESVVRERGGTLSGSFTETTKGTSGSVTGTVGGGRISARVSGLGFDATLRASVSDRHQAVTIVPDGAVGGVREVSLSLTRR